LEYFNKFVKDPLTIAHEGNAELQKGDKGKLEKEQAKAIEIFKAEEEEKRRKSNRRSFLAGSFVVKDLKPLNAEKDFVVNGLVNFITLFNHKII